MLLLAPQMLASSVPGFSASFDRHERSAFQDRDGGATSLFCNGSSYALRPTQTPPHPGFALSTFPSPTQHHIVRVPKEAQDGTERLFHRV